MGVCGSKDGVVTTQSEENEKKKSINFTLDDDVGLYKLKKSRAGCSGMFWRSDPTGHEVLISNTNWPRDNATLQGQVLILEGGEKWLRVQQVKQVHDEWMEAPQGAHLPFEYDNHYYLEAVDE